MRATADRRLRIRDFISERRHTSIPELMQEFHISKSTVLRDLDALAETISYYTTAGNGGGIHATEGWYSSCKYLSVCQESFLIDQMTRLEAESDRKMMESILKAFAKPKHK